MTVFEFLSSLHSLDIKVWIEDDQLRYRAPKGVMTSALKQELMERKAEIFSCLQEARTAKKIAFEPILSINRNCDLPLSFSQQRMWLLNQLDSQNPSYNESFQFRITGTLNVAALEQTLNEIIRRHEALRSIFPTVDGLVVQRIVPTLTINIPVVDLQGLEEAEIQQLVTKEVRQPFDLGKQPLLRVSLLRQKSELHLLILTLHHIIVDGWSMGIFIKELSAIYQAFSTGSPTSLPELTIQYADFAVWQRKWLTEELQQQQLDYWKQQLADAPPLLELPTDYPRSSVENFSGAVQKWKLNSDLTAQLKTLSQQSGTTLFVTLLAAFAVLLHRYSGQDDICIGSPFANRNRTEVEPLIGCFINSLVLRTQIKDNPSFKELLAQVSSVVLDAQAHQNVPFERVVEALQPERSLGYNPLFQVMFVLENFSLDTLEISGISLTPEMVDRGTAQFDLSLSIWETQKGLIGSWEYNSDLFEADTIARMTLHFQTLLETIVSDPNHRVGELPLLTSQERHQLLVEWNDTQADYPLDRCIHQLFEEQVQRTPNAVAVVFENQQLTYDQLNCRANQLAHYLRSLGVGADVLVGLCVERSLEMVIGLLGILKAGGAYVPVDPEYPQERLSFMLLDAAVSVLLTQHHLVEKLPEQKAPLVCLDSDWHLVSQSSQDNPTADVQANNLAYVIYTSGSTGKPKGVMIEHRSLVNLIAATKVVFGFNSSDRVLQFSSISFDSAVEEICHCLSCGGTLVLRTDEMLNSVSTFLQKCWEWKLTVLELPTAYWHELTSELAMINEILPTSVRLVIIGGEQALLEKLKQWRKYVDDRLRCDKLEEPPLLINGYGPSEATVGVTLCKLSELVLEDTRLQLPIGRPINNVQIYILDRYLQPVPIGVAGELYIGGICLARGYLNRTELTAEKFISNPFSTDPDSRLYKTGDKARYLLSGNIKYLGRIDNQVKIRGFRIELGEIETVLSQNPNVQASCVIVREDIRGEKYLVAYVVPHQQHTDINSELRNFLSSQLPLYMVPTAFVILETLPLTPNGKVDYRSLSAPDLDLQMSDKFVAPRTSIEKTVAQIWAEVLRVEQVGINDNFFELGGHSLLATQVISRLQEAFQISLPLRYLFKSPTVAQLSEAILTELQTGSVLTVPAIVPFPRDKDIPLSWAQERLWFLHHLEGESGAYTMSCTARLVGNLNVKALEGALQEMVRRHEVLRTRFEVKDNKPVQVIAPEITITLPVVDLQNLPDPRKQVEQEAIKEARKPFDLANGLVLRVKMWQVAQDEYILLLAIHHIAADGWSMGVLIRELSDHYRAISTSSSVTLPELAVQYADFALWQRQWLTNQVLERQLSYWKQQLTGAPPLLELPTDRPRPAVQTFRGSVQRFQVDVLLTSQLRQISQESEATLFMTLLAGFVVLLSRYSGQTDLVVGSPIANRNRQETESLIGFFVNTLALRFDLSQEPSFQALLAQVRQVTLNAYEHQDLPFEILVEELQVERQLNRNPLVQVVFALQNAPTFPWDLPGLSVEEIPWHLDTVRVDLELHFWETPEGLEGFCCYSSDLFDAATIARMMNHYQNLLEAICLQHAGANAANPQQPVALLPLLTQQERHQLLVEWNSTQADYPQNKCIHQLFEEQVARTPDAVAVVFENQQLTYHQLNCRANQLAHYLRSLGVGADVLVGLCVERSLLMVIGLLAILKAGGAYVPLDPEYPTDRLSFILEDTQVSLLLTQEQLIDKLPPNQANLVFLDQVWSQISQNNQDNLTIGATASDLANVIYTSGSTGKPKGVMVEHRGLCNLAQAQIQAFGVHSDNRVLQFASLSFDACIWEVIMALRTGATLYLGTKDSLMPGTPLIERLGNYDITHITLPPSALAVLPVEELPALQTIIVAGEACSAELIKQWSAGRNFFNAYGPTEASVCATVAKCSIDDKKISIGRPISNTQIYILDSYLQPVPIGVPGELHIGGVGLARGYLNRVELTTEKFISNPFSDEPNSRLYKTGDLARYLPDGNIEYLGRIDNQVKVRGFRIELGEIEAVLSQHPLVQEGVVVARVDTTGDKQLVAYLVPDLKNKVLPQQLAQWQSEYVSDWQILYEQAYGQAQASADDLTFNISGWNSSYTKQPIPDWEMQEWVENTVSRILSLSPQRVLEIGCGTGLLLSRVAKHCQQYWGCDYSSAAIQHVEQVCNTVKGLEHVRLLHQMADNFAGIPKGEFDTVIVNSVIQYFPSVEYLLQVLEGAMAAIGASGTIFVGDVRSLPLLQPFHAAVQLSEASEERTIEQWQRMVHSSVAAEEELVIDPGFFIALQTRFPQITWVEIQPKRGNSQNELTQFRYDVTLHVDSDVQKTVVPWLNWQLDGLELTQIENQLHQQQPELLGIRGVPNQRVQQALQIWQWLEHPPAVETVGQLRQLLAQQPTVGINPEEFWELGQHLGYTVHLSWWESSQDGCYDVVLCRNSSTPGHQAMPGLGNSWRGDANAIAFWDISTVTIKPWTDYTNNPLHGKLVQKLVPQVRSFIQQKLPDYMVPQAFVVLNALPLTPNGKVDRRALPTPDTATRNLSTGFVLPRTPIEAQLLQIWSEVLGVERIGVKDNFFELGGHSLLVTQVMSRVNSAFGLDLPIQTMFESPTVAGLAAYLKVMDWATQDLSVKEVSGEIVEF